MTRTETRIGEAALLFTELNKMNSQGACLYVAAQALGGSLTIEAVTSFLSRARSSWIDDLAAMGLTVGKSIQIISEVDSREVEGILQTLFSRKRKTMFPSGILVVIIFPEDTHTMSHGFALFAPERMSTTVKKSLRSNNEYMVVDTAGGEVVGRSSNSDIAEYVNQVRLLQAQVSFVQIYERKLK